MTVWSARAGDRGGDPCRRGREDAARPAVARRRRHPRRDARRQPPRLDRRLPRRLRRDPAGARARAAPARGRRDRAPPDVSDADRAPRRFASLVKIEHTVFALPFAYVGAFLAVDAVPSRRPPLDHGRDGRCPLAGDGAEPADRRAHRRAQPAHGDARAAAGRAEPRAGVGFCAARSPCSSSPSGSSTRSCAGCGRSRSPGSWSTRT